MMQLQIVAVGKVRRGPWADLCDDYAKRLRRYVRLEVDEVADVRGDDREAARAAEGERLLRACAPGAELVALSEEGEGRGSEALARWLEGEALAARSRIAFVIGGPDGLAPEVVGRARLCLSLSPMTFNPEMARVILLEQLYRAMTIVRGEPYHRT